MAKQEEKLDLAESIITDLELNRNNLQDILLKALRLCRLIKDEFGEKVFTYETCGYPRDENLKLSNDAWDIINKVERYYYRNEKDKKVKYAEPRLIGELLDENEILKTRLSVTADPTSYGGNMTPHMISVSKNTAERNAITQKFTHNVNFVNTIKGFTYKYILNIYNQLKYGDITESIYESVRNEVDNKIAQICPENTKKFLSVYDNLSSDNNEDWANAVHSCRRIIKELADKLYPPQNKKIDHNGKSIDIGNEKYVNRLMLYIESKKESQTYKNIVVSTLDYIGNSLDAITKGVNKGTHDSFTKYEAQRIVIYTYMLIGDIINL